MVLVGSGSGFRIQVFFIRIRNLDPDFHFLDPDPYENDRDPSHWVGTGSGTLSFLLSILLFCELISVTFLLFLCLSLYDFGIGTY